ncbi:type VI secretion system-associated protein TagO [Pectobacterium aroidearum]|uniref:type VI secretion system-associated protein TagO n=1 Tax=Pectobacterium aroidearum TaxID=1201031 RepID=UPI0015F07D6F|nr:type VI secretion system-associated protein TagO [Pectobacterium aroidearum]MBA5229582.1 type VI secretion protein [Pectobacterium aroidearum]MBA5739172.1 type VI secretion protein [Pectobacterium aroidearum]UXK00593.1 type VI secretion protein [Pectobacterium aroidearum]
MKSGFLCIATGFIALTSVATNAAEKPKNFDGVQQCRTVESGIDRLECYDKSLPPTYTKSDQKLESRDQCPDETNGTKRLACYDRFFTTKFDKSKSTAESAPENKGDWSVNIKISPIDDSQNVFVSLEANESFTSPYGERVRPTLNVLCREKKTELLINWDVYLGLGETTMLHRLDKQKAVNRKWTISTDTKAVFYSGRDIDFIKSLMSADKMYARITPYNENAVSVTFDLRGLSGAIKPLQKACGWK